MCFYFSLQRNWFLKRPALGFWRNDKENIQVLTKGEHRQNRLRALPCYLLSVDKDLRRLGHKVTLYHRVFLRPKDEDLVYIVLECTGKKKSTSVTQRAL